MPVIQRDPAADAVRLASSDAIAAKRLNDHFLDFYEKAAAEYDGWAGGVHVRAAERLVQLVALQPAESALDVGCGTGLVTHRLSHDAPDGFIFGIDISPHMLAVAHSRRPKGSAAVFAIMDADSLLMRSDSFDTVTFGQTLPYLCNPDAALQEAIRVLRTGGRIVVSCQRRQLSTPAENVFFAELSHLADRLPLDIPRPPKERAWFGEPDVLHKLLVKAGFCDVRTTQMLTGNHTIDAQGWIHLMMFAGPYPHALLSHLGPALRAHFLGRFEHAARQLSQDRFRYHRAFTFGLARKP